ncbi:MAG TPA: hypothetical protein VG273_15405 [Bryobacteraceae bacterium]|jgi:hypothetical protein|nr:hypothetical protein [Bryobacteraceae bacterium]
MSISNSRRGGVLAGLLIVALGMVCLAVVVGISIARNIKVDTQSTPNGDHVSIETPAGKFSIHAHDESARALINVPMYPGASQSPHHGGGADFEWTSRDGRDDKGLSVAGDEMITSDPVDRVVEFYQSKLPSWVISNDRDGKFHMELAEGGYKRIIVIEGKHDGTHIGVATIGAPAAN